MYWPVFLDGESFFYRDFSRGYLPEKIFQSKTIRDGFFPFWSPWIFAGIPHHATLESQIYYPLNCLSWFQPCYWFFSLNTILHLLVGGLGVTFWLRCFQVADILVIGGSCLWPVLGINIGLLEFFPMIAALAWLPWILGSLERAASAKDKGKSFFWLGLGGLFLGVQLLVNYPTLSMYTILIELTFLFGRGKSSWMQGLVNLISIVTIGTMIYSIQLIPTRELTLLSVRGAGLSYEDASEIGLSLEQMRNFLFHSYSVQPQDVVPCLGIVLTFGVFLAIDNMRSVWIFLCSIFWFIASLGKATPLHFWLFKFVPVIQYERKPFNLSIMALILLFYLGIIGLDSLRKFDKAAPGNLTPQKDAAEGKGSFKDEKILVVDRLVRILFGGALLGATMSACIAIFREDFLLYFFGNHPDKEVVVQGVRRYFLFSSAMNGLSLRMLLFAGGIAAFRRWPQKLGYVFLIAVALADPLITMNHINPTTDKNFFENAPVQIKLLKNEGESARILLAGDTYLDIVRQCYFRIRSGERKALDDWKNTLEARFPMMFGIPDSGGNGSIIQRTYLSIIDTWNGLSACSTSPSFRLLESIGTRYLISHRNMAGDGVSLISSAPFYLYRLEKTMPRVGMFFDREYLPPDSGKRLIRLNDPEFPQTQKVILSEEVAFDKPSFPLEVRTRIIPSKDPNRLEIEYSTGAEGFLYVLDQMYPGWKAQIDEKEVPILTGNGWMRVLKAPSGTHRVIFSFFPVGFFPGFAISFLGVLLSILLMFRGIRSKSK